MIIKFSKKKYFYPHPTENQFLDPQHKIKLIIVENFIHVIEHKKL